MAGGALAPQACDVFISHRGPDSKLGLVGHLERELKRINLDVFVDYALEKGTAAWQTTLAKLRGAHRVLLVLSPRFEGSCWCLEEVRVMAERLEAVLPVFYDREPGSWDLTMLPDAAEKLRRSQPDTPADIIQRWEQALNSIPSKSGWVHKSSEQREARLVDEVQSKLLQFFRPLAHLPEEFEVGLQDKLPGLTQKLQQVQVLGLWGMGGIGKTTLASALFNYLLPRKWEASCFLANVRDRASDLRGVVELQRQLLHVLTGKQLEPTDKDDGRQLLTHHLRRRKALLVIDDVDDLNGQLTQLVPRGSLHADSLLVVTSRNSALLRQYGCEVAGVELLQPDLAMELFLGHAFGGKPAGQAMADKVQGVVDACGGLPLTLKVMGSYLRLHSNDSRIWEHALKKLKKAEKLEPSSQEQLFARLRISYDALGSSVKRTFLDAACFFLDRSIVTAEHVWSRCEDSTFYSDLNTLESCCLLRRVHEHFSMHDQVRDLARAIARECPKAERTHVFGGDALALLQEHSRQGAMGGIMHACCVSRETPTQMAVEGFWIEAGLPPDIAYGSSYNIVHGRSPAPMLLPVRASAFRCMQNLRILVLDGVRLAAPLAGFELPRLAMLLWRGGQRRTLPLDLRSIRNAAVLFISSHTELTSLPDKLQVLTSLKQLDVSDCVSLTRLPESLGQLTGLQQLIMHGCSGLVALPEGLWALTGLHLLNLSGCESLTVLPEALGALTDLQQLYLFDCKSLTALPESLGQLTGLQQLDLGACYALTSLPASLGALTKLQQLNFREYSPLISLTESQGPLTSLRHLNFREILPPNWLPESQGALTTYRHLEIKYESLIALPEWLWLLTRLQELDLGGCKSLSALPEPLGQLTGLQQLNLSWCESLTALPESLGMLTGLQQLKLNGCALLTALPDSLGALTGLQQLDLWGCASLTALPESLGALIGLQQLILERCASLTALPKSLGRLTGLQRLNLMKCRSLNAPPESLRALTGLQWLELDGCEDEVWEREAARITDGLRDMFNSIFSDKS